MPTSTDVRKYADTVLEQGKAAIDEARKPLYAWVGVTELAYDRLRSQLEELPEQAQAGARKLQARAQGGAPALDPTQVTARVRQALESYATQARKAYDTYRGQAREQYEMLSHRGELVVGRLSQRPEVRAAFARTERLLGRSEKLVEEADEQVTSTPASTDPQARKAPARKPPARKATPGTD
jgi:hypothetical protein